MVEIYYHNAEEMSLNIDSRVVLNKNLSAVPAGKRYLILARQKKKYCPLYGWLSLSKVFVSKVNLFPFVTCHL